jgi:hypothetical protein
MSKDKSLNELQAFEVLIRKEKTVPYLNKTKTKFYQIM